MEQCFSLKDVLKEKAKKSFLAYSSIKVKKLVNKNVCHEACDYFLKNEKRLIEEYRHDAKGLTIDTINEEKFVKYFEYPFRENGKLYGKFVSSQIFKIAEYFLDTPVYLKSLEIHSRCALGTAIPPHQDNAYYGLKNGRGLTFYIPINDEFANMGGLQYFKNPSNYELVHEPSNSSGFSLKVKEKKLDFDIFSPDYLPGDCTIHHSRSIHFADDVPFNAKRSLVVRISVYSLNESEKDGHLDWYKNMIKRNREFIANKNQE